MRKLVLLAFLAAILPAAVPSPTEARVVRLVVEQTRTFADGKGWGDAGPYQRLDGTAIMEVDPRDPLNAVIVNLDKAPKNAKGLVEFSAPFFILKPIDMAKGNRKIFYGVNNRGNKNFLARMSASPLRGTSPNNPLTVDDVNDDGLLLKLGYTYVDAGWQGDVLPGGDRLTPRFPVATEADGRPIVGRMRVEYDDAEGFTRTLASGANFRPYEPADTNTARSTLTVRATVGGTRTPIAPDRWAFGRCARGQASLVPTTTDICLFDGFQVDKIYELIYPAKNPIVMGLGYAVTRDVASFLRYQLKDDAGTPNPLAQSATNVGIRRVYEFGSSSTGMYSRDFLYLGFNEDESHRRVFDAALIMIPGTHRLFANVQFADPNVYSRQDVWHDFTSYSYPPLTYAVTTDPISGVRDGILKRPATDPLVLQVDSANEFWHMNASLNVVDGQGNAVSIPDNVRLYFASSYQHGGGTGLLHPPGPMGMCQSLGQGTGWGPTIRALSVALDEWADRGIAPPRSNYPTLLDGTLVSLDAARVAFPSIPGVKFPVALNEISLLDFGPGFGPTGGRLTQLPPAPGRSAYQLFVPRPDKDGLDVGGIRPMEVAAPTATITGWNVRAAGHRAPDLCGLTGSYIPFARTKAEREAKGDPRLSMEERYGDPAGFERATEAAARKLVDERFLLQADADRYIQAARAARPGGL